MLPRDVPGLTISLQAFPLSGWAPFISLSGGRQPDPTPPQRRPAPAPEAPLRRAA